MKNWIRIGGRYINMANVIDIITTEERENRKAEWVPGHNSDSGFFVPGYYPTQPCTVFRTVATAGGEGYHGPAEIEFFGEDRENILSWLGNVVEEEIMNLNFSDTGWK